MHRYPRLNKTFWLVTEDRSPNLNSKISFNDRNHLCICGKKKGLPRTQRSSPKVMHEYAFTAKTPWLFTETSNRCA